MVQVRITSGVRLSPDWADLSVAFKVEAKQFKVFQRFIPHYSFVREVRNGTPTIHTIAYKELDPPFNDGIGWEGQALSEYGDYRIIGPLPLSEADCFLCQPETKLWLPVIGEALIKGYRFMTHFTEDRSIRFLVGKDLSWRYASSLQPQPLVN